MIFDVFCSFCRQPEGLAQNAPKEMTLTESAQLRFHAVGNIHEEEACNLQTPRHVNNTACLPLDTSNDLHFRSA